MSYSCGVCWMSFTSKYYLELHRSIHTDYSKSDGLTEPDKQAIEADKTKFDNQSYHCGVCWMSFSSKPFLFIHVRNSHMGK